MPNRIIKESLCVSENVNLLTAEEERLFIRLITKADDYGRYDGRAAVIKGAVFPLKDDININDVECWLQKLASQEVDLIRFYTDRGIRYLYFVNWEKHQGPPRSKKSKYPEPTPENTIPPLPAAGICKQMSAIVPDIRYSDLDIRSYGSRSISSSASADGGYSEDFEKFWKTYPRKVGKGAAWKAWQKIKKRPSVDELIAAVKRHMATEQWQKDNGQYIPHPTTWLNQHRWEDEPDVILKQHKSQQDPLERPVPPSIEDQDWFKELQDRERNLQS